MLRDKSSFSHSEMRQPYVPPHYRIRSEVSKAYIDSYLFSWFFVPAIQPDWFLDAIPPEVHDPIQAEKHDKAMGNFLSKASSPSGSFYNNVQRGQACKGSL